MKLNWSQPPIFDAANVAITGGTIAGAVIVGSAIGGTTGVPIQIGGTAIPFISPSTGSMGNNGAISGLTALPLTYANCYLYLPASAISAGSAAGWYFAQMSSSTAGTVYNNTYTTGVPTIPTPVAFVTTGPGAFTGDTTEQGITLTVPVLQANSRMRAYMDFEANNSAGAKTFRARHSTITGSAYLSQAITTTTNYWAYVRIRNRGVTNSQFGLATGGNSAGGGIFTGPAVGAVDTTAATTLVLTGQKTVATDFWIIDGVDAEYVL